MLMRADRGQGRRYSLRIKAASHLAREPSFGTARTRRLLGGLHGDRSPCPAPPRALQMKRSDLEDRLSRRVSGGRHLANGRVLTDS